MSKDVKRMSLEQAESFTSDQVTSAIKSCMSSRACGPNNLSIFHLKNLGPLATEHLTALYNDSFKPCRLPSIWKTSLVIPIPMPGKDSSQGTSYRPISLVCPAAKILEALILPFINEFLSPAKDQHGFRPRHSTSSALLQLTTDIETCFNQQTPPHRTMCVIIDLTAAFDTVSHDTLISKIVGSSLPPHHSMAVLLPERETSHVAHPEHTPSQDPPKYTHRGFTASVGPIPKYIGVYLYHTLSFNKHSHYVAESIKQKQHPQCLGRYILGTRRNTNDDLQGGRKIDHQLRCTCFGVQTYTTPTTEKSMKTMV